MLFLTVFFTLILLLVIGIIIMNTRAFGPGTAEFYARGKESGLTMSEIRLLKKTADFLGLDKPKTLFGSVDNINACIAEITNRLEADRYQSPELRDLLDSLYDYRKKIELKKQKRVVHVKSSREIYLGQILKVSATGLNKPYTAKVEDNSPQGIRVRFNEGESFPSGFVWAGSVNVYFWKQEDAGYYFQSEVKNPHARFEGSLLLAHSENLIRSQKRKHIRVNVNKNAYLFYMDDISMRNSRVETGHGTFCQLTDISEGGVSLLVHGRARNGIALKVQYKLLGRDIVVCGIVQSTEFDIEKNLSLLRIKLIEPAFEMRNMIRSYIYSVFEEKNGEEGSFNPEEVKELENAVDSDNTQEELSPEEPAEEPVFEEPHLDEDAEEVEYIDEEIFSF